MTGLLSKEAILDRIAALVSTIRKDERIGSALEKYDVEHLWELGENVLLYRDFAADRDDAIREIINSLESRSIYYLPVLLRNAETARRAWPSVEDYAKAARGVSYGKLKAALPLFDPSFVSQAEVDRKDLDHLAEALRSSTYEQILEEVRQARKKYGSRAVAIDFDELYSALYLVNDLLRQATAAADTQAVKTFRGSLCPDFADNVRRLIAAMRTEEALQKLSRSIPRSLGSRPDARGSEFEHQLRAIADCLLLLRNGVPADRERLRQRIGISGLGELSTLLKAICSDEELERYRRGQKLLEELRSRVSAEGERLPFPGNQDRGTSQ
jgi:hypothetical protein